MNPLQEIIGEIKLITKELCLTYSRLIFLGGFMQPL